jgi:Protein of unknown function (DUF2934)
MAADSKQAIRERAYAIWEEEGCPLDRDLDHWLRAEAEIAAAPPVGVLHAGKPVTARGKRHARKCPVIGLPHFQF